MVPARYFVALALGGVTAAFGLTRAEPPTAHAAPTPEDTLGYQFPKGLHFVGNLSCASAACHAAGDAGGRPGSEYTTWAGGDPHFRAFQVLSEPRSRRMVELLHGSQPAHKDTRCLSCHAPLAATAEHSAAHGVGCESCHGPAEKWLTVHYQDEFKVLSRREKAERYGLYPTKDLAFRTTLCASCHVGDAGREVDHDLIAAGHPRLAFEYTGYHHNPKYKRHWNETSYGPDFDARAWEIGQVACARSAVKLLASRASKADHVWPELSEYSCFACHKEIDRKNWKGLSSSRGRRNFMLWGNWYFGALGVATGDEFSPEGVSQLAEFMENSPADRKRVAAEAKAVADRLAIKLYDLQRASDSANRYDGKYLSRQLGATIRHAMTADGRWFNDQDWDTVTQHYLGVAAYYYAFGGVDPTGRELRLRPPIIRLGTSLSFPKGYNSPKGLEPRGLLDEFRQLHPNPHRDEPR